LERLVGGFLVLKEFIAAENLSKIALNLSNNAVGIVPPAMVQH
jgi:hypothetical protein